MRKSPICVSVLNMKGGVGKTTIASLLVRYADRFGLDTLAVDLDPQANLSQALMGETRYRNFISRNGPSIVELFKGYQAPSGGSTSPSSIDINSIVYPIFRDKKLGLIPSRFDFSDNLVSSLNPNPRVLAQAIANHFQEKDLIIIDCAPTESIFTTASYHASRYVLIPVKPEYFATIGFPLMKDSLDRFKANNPSHQIDVIGVVINNSTYHLSGNQGGPERSRSMRDILLEAAKNGWDIFDSQLPLSRGFPKIMRGDFRNPGDALVSFRELAYEFLDAIGIKIERNI